MSNKNNIYKLKSELKSLEKHLNLAKSALRSLEEAEKEAFESIPGVVGTFDGEYMVTESGEKHLVPSNYAAKSLLLFGDKMKMVDENGKPFFKNIDKLEPEEITGVLSKKEDEWHILAKSGSYKVSDSAASFHKAYQNAEATALVPKGNTGVPFAALKSVKSKESDKKEEKQKDSTVPNKPSPEKVVEKPKPKKSESTSKPEEKKELPKTDKTQTIDLDDDDLV